MSAQVLNQSQKDDKNLYLIRLKSICSEFKSLLKFNLGLILTIPVVLYIGFKLTIHGETIILRRIFGDDYYKYEKSVNEIFPMPSFLSNK